MIRSLRAAIPRVGNSLNSLSRNLGTTGLGSPKTSPRMNIVKRGLRGVWLKLVKEKVFVTSKVIS